MKLGSIAGVTLPVRDVATSAAFYAAIGFRPGRASANSAVAYVNWFWVELASGEPDPGAAAIGVKVDSVEAARDELIELGLSDSLVGPIGITAAGRRGFRLADPDGYRLEFFEKA